MTTLKNRLTSIKKSISGAEQAANRPEHSVQLLAVSKTWPAPKLRELAEFGQTRFGENYLQEALVKIEDLADLSLEWHFIGPIQSNKTRDISANFAWIHSVDRLKIARRLSEQRPQNLPALNICIQVNIDNETTKSGVDQTALLNLANDIQALENITVRGLMIIPAKTEDINQQRTSFKAAHTLFHQLKEIIPSVDTLSMGMSGDMSLAIEHGSTMVRIGTALFGQRTTTATTNNVK